MPRTAVRPTWPGQDVFIIGGGKSLESFGWSLLRSELTIGCNDAYLLGEDICKMVLFGDHKWFVAHRDAISKFPRRVFSICPTITEAANLPWLNILVRQAQGLSKRGTTLSWNGNTGAAAINLALLLGAKRIFLLGFDFRLSGGQNNWHPNVLDTPNSAIYGAFKTGFLHIKKSLPSCFPNTEIINVNDDSDLDVFRTIKLNELWKDGKRCDL